MLSRAGVKCNRKLILVSINRDHYCWFQGVLSRALSPSLGSCSCSFSLAFSLVLLPSFLLSLSPSGSRLPSFLTSLSCNAFVGQMHLEHSFLSAVTVRICMFITSRTNLHTCTLPLAGSRSPLIKYARGSHIGFPSTSQTRSCALRMPRYVTFTLLPDLGITQRTARSRSFESAASSERNALDYVVVLRRVSGPTTVNTASALRLQRKRCCNKWRLLLALDEHPLCRKVSRQQGPNGGCTHP